MVDITKELQMILEDILKRDAIYELHCEHGKIVAIKVKREKKTCVG